MSLFLSAPLLWTATCLTLPYIQITWSVSFSILHTGPSVAVPLLLLLEQTCLWASTWIFTYSHCDDSEPGWTAGADRPFLCRTVRKILRLWLDIQSIQCELIKLAFFDWPKQCKLKLNYLKKKMTQREPVLAPTHLSMHARTCHSCR